MEQRKEGTYIRWMESDETDKPVGWRKETVRDQKIGHSQGDGQGFHPRISLNGIPLGSCLSRYLQ